MNRPAADTGGSGTPSEPPRERAQLRLTRQWALRGPVDNVFRMLTEPGLIRRWWGPAGFTTPEIVLDLTVGGRYRFTMQPPDGEQFHLAGEFVEIAAPYRLVYTFRWEEPDPDDQETTVTLSLHAAADGTELSLDHGPFATESRLRLHTDGWADSIEKLSRLLDA